MVFKELLCPSRSLWRRAWQDRVSQHNIRPARPRPRLQRARPRPRPIFWSETGLVLRPTGSDHITDIYIFFYMVSVLFLCLKYLATKDLHVFGLALGGTAACIIIILCICPMWLTWIVIWDQRAALVYKFFPIPTCSHKNVFPSPLVQMSVSMYRRLFLNIKYQSLVSQCSTAVRTIVRVTQQVNGKWPFSGCQNSVTPEPID